MKPNEIQKKIKSFAHDEYNKNEFLEIENIKKKLYLEVTYLIEIKVISL